MTSKYRGATVQVPRIRITFSMKSVLSKLVDKGLLRYKRGNFFPTSYKAVLHYDISNIVNYISAVFRGLSNYYGFAHNWYDAKTIYNYFGLFCAAMTIAHKTKSKVPKVFTLMQIMGADVLGKTDNSRKSWCRPTLASFASDYPAQP